VEGKDTLAWQAPAGISRARNVIWNGLARLLQVGLQFVFVPIYIALLGPDSYGLVVLSATVMTMLMVLDQFMNAVLTREFGQGNGVEGETARLWSLLAGLERMALGFAVLVALVLPLAGPLLTRHWAASGASSQTLQQAFMLMGLMVGAQLPGMLYASGLQGLQRQKLLAVVRIVWTPLYYGGGGLALLVVERNILVLFAWQTVAFVALALVLRLVLRKTMPPHPAAMRAEPMPLRTIWPLGAGAALLGLSGSIAGQIDKVFVAAVASPLQFAAYGLAFTVALQAMSAIINAFGSAVLPHFAQLLKAGEGSDAALRHAYHRWSQVIACVSITGMGLLFLWGPLLIDLWLGQGSPLAADIKRLLPVVILAMLLGALVTAPFMLLLAADRLAPIIGVNAAAITLAVVVLPLALSAWGTVAGAVYTLILMGGYCLVVVPLLHQHLLTGSLGRWLVRDFAVPLGVGLLVFAGSLLLLPAAPSISLTVVHGLLTAIAAAATLVAVLPDGRAQMRDSLRHLTRGRNQA
jgi:O-antigen/teichoic acid export membrane protein